MRWAERYPSWAFGLRFAFILALLLSPLPWLADAYTQTLGHAANALLFIADPARAGHEAERWPIGFRFEPPERVRANGSWVGVLRLENRATGETSTIGVNTREFSYRSVATFVALALAGSVRLRGPRQHAIVFGGGLGLTFAITSILAVVTALRFGFGGGLGVPSGPIIQTLHGALTNPVMMYAWPLFCFWLAIWLARYADPRPRSELG